MTNQNTSCWNPQSVWRGRWGLGAGYCDVCVFCSPVILPPLMRTWGRRGLEERRKKETHLWQACSFFIFSRLPSTTYSPSRVSTMVLSLAKYSWDAVTRNYTGVSPNEKQLKGLSKVWPTWMYGNQVREGMNWLSHLIILYWSKVWSVSNQTMALDNVGIESIMDGFIQEFKKLQN